MLHARIVDEDVDRAELARRIGDHLADLGGLRHVGAGIADLHAVLGGEVALDAVDGCGVAEPVEHDGAAFRRERRGDAESDAAGGPGDDGDLAFQHIEPPR